MSGPRMFAEIGKPPCSPPPSGLRIVMLGLYAGCAASRCRSSAIDLVLRDLALLERRGVAEQVDVRSARSVIVGCEHRDARRCRSVP